ncbi:cytochrome P450 [Crepidotus variabilis]|uniref:Cytochrome P450 n=1 Tax=Crepidotus variabilis TaxID=179855 RepID=A0A9P6JM03_9AGAR|nr:cytochrome P450 [Crepidotus variabilis]
MSTIRAFISSWLLVDLIVICAVSLVVFKLGNFVFSSAHTQLPPGPPQNWIIGNLLDLPRDNQWLLFTEWSRHYGEILYIRVLHTHIIVVNSVEVITELFDKRYNTYSSRTPTPMLDLLKNNYFTSSLPYGNRWRAHRRMMQTFLSADATKSYRELQHQKVINFLKLLINTPNKFLGHIRHEALAIVMSALYAYDVAVENDPYVDIAQKAVANLVKTILPGSFLVNVIPILRIVPEWFPGGGFKTFARETQALVDQMRDGTINVVRTRMVTGEQLNCISAKLLQDSTTDDELLDIKSVCTTLYAAGAESTVSTLQTFFYAMSNYYDVQRRAQEEIDAIVGCKRLPTIEDRPSLPYVEALYRETLRWYPVFPVGGPHYTTDEDTYEGYRIPKGTTVIPNIWGITRNQSRYPDPESFNPSRFFQEDGSLNDDDVRYVFGFGRRSCPGRHLASVTVWLTIVNVLATFDIRRKKDLFGNEIPVNAGHTGNALAIHPHPFECDITPRTEAKKCLILEQQLIEMPAV